MNFYHDLTLKIYLKLVFELVFYQLCNYIYQLRSIYNEHIQPQIPYQWCSEHALLALRIFKKTLQFKNKSQTWAIS
jgi:hypothetical protein